MFMLIRTFRQKQSCI